MGVLLLLLSAACADCPRLNFSVAGAAAVANTLFEGCSGVENGGAYYCFAQSASINISHCSFRSCQASLRGGAIFFMGGGGVITRSDFSNCTSDRNAFCYLALSGTSVDSMWVTDTSGSGSHSNNITFQTVSFTTALSLVNSSYNAAVTYGSGFAIQGYLPLQLQFCIFDTTSPANVL
jgi:hypothetical protein